MRHRSLSYRIDTPSGPSPSPGTPPIRPISSNSPESSTTLSARPSTRAHMPFTPRLRIRRAGGSPQHHRPSRCRDSFAPETSGGWRQRRASRPLS
jgi:hypothetical protein